MTDSLASIRAEIAEIKDSIASAAARQEQIPMEIEDLRCRIENLETESADLTDAVADYRQRLDALERAESVLTEHQPQIPIPAEPEPRSVPERTPERERIRHELEGLGHHRTEAPPKPVTKPAKPHTAPAVKSDPLRVRTRHVTSHAPREEGKREHTAEGATVDLSTVSETWMERADLVHEIMVEHGKPMSNYEVAVALTDGLMDATIEQAQRVTAHCMRILFTQRRVAWTGERAPGAAGTIRMSPVWQLNRKEQ